MSNYGWTNADGEPIMDGAAYRFEQELDAQSAYERQFDDFYDNEPDEYCEGDADDCPFGGCVECDGDMSEPMPMEDQWLDGSYEE